MDMLGPLELSHEGEWNRNKRPEYRGFLIMEVKQYTKVLAWD